MDLHHTFGGEDDRGEPLEASASEGFHAADAGQSEQGMRDDYQVVYKGCVSV